MKKVKNFLCCIVCIAIGLFVLIVLIGVVYKPKVVISNWQPETIITSKTTIKSATYESMNVPAINSSFKSWMDYRAVTDKNSPQYKMIKRYGWSDSQGFMRASGEIEYGINDDYYMVALGSYYGTTIGTKYRITTDTGNVFYVVLTDCKADKHTDDMNQYVPKNNNVVEFLIDSSKLNQAVKYHGTANVHSPLHGSIVSIEKIDFTKQKDD